jgi:hypothetical protein
MYTFRVMKITRDKVRSGRLTPATDAALARAAVAEARSISRMLEFCVSDYLRRHGYLPRRARR